MKTLRSLCRFSYPIHTKFITTPTAILFHNSHRVFSAFSEDPQLNEFMEFMNKLKNFEKSGVPKDAGTDSDDGFDLGRMTRLMDLLGRPQSKFKAVHIAGTKGKGSTSAYLSSILRAEGYSVGSYTSPHIRSIRERITLGTSGESVSAQTLDHHFQRIKPILHKAVELEKRHLSHFEVFTAVAFSIFAQENVDIAIIEAGLGGARDATNIIPSSGLSLSIITSIGEEHMAALGGSLESIAMAKSGIIKYGRPLVLGGPFLPHIKRILHDKASSMSSPIVSASDPGNKSVVKGFNNVTGQPYQSCDIVLAIERDIPLFIELLDVKLRMIGSHQLQNAATATCAALCLQNQGWNISGRSIRAGLECASLLGRSQFLTSVEAEKLGLPGATIMLDGAHTKDSAKALANTVSTTFPTARVALVVAMANDKDHLGFARELLSVKGLEAVFLTEVRIACDKTRTTSMSMLINSWIRASTEMGIRIHTLDQRVAEHESLRDLLQTSAGESERQAILFSERDVMASIKAGNQIISAGNGEGPGVIVVTGSLHIVSAVLGSLQESS